MILMNGAPIDMTDWIDGCNAVLEAWYPGEQGAQALCEILFGEICPCGKLPITFPKNVGQVPLFYSYKPSGRGYGYVENDGAPRYPFGYGLSYTSFSFDNFRWETGEDGVSVTFDLENTGDYDGAQVVQIYFSGRNCDVVRPLLELNAYKRVELNRGETKTVTIDLPAGAFFYYDGTMAYGMHDGDYTISVRTSSVDLCGQVEVKVRNKKVWMA